MTPLVLASTSPRRQQLLAEAGISCEVYRPREVDETPLLGELPEPLVTRLAEAKARSVAIDFPDRLVLGADTIVYHDGEILNKPADLAEAEAMLRRLSGQTHRVCTGVSLLRLHPALHHLWAATSSVTFHQLSDETIAAAMQLTNPLDKAGGYAIQEQEALLVARTCGYRTTIIGLPVEDVLAQLRLWQEQGCI